MKRAELRLHALQGLPLISPGDDLAAIIAESIQRNDEQLMTDDVLVIAQKIVSKAENRYVELASVIPGTRAVQLAREVDKDPRFVELVLRESSDVVRQRKGLLIVRHRNGYVYANAGIDQSNIISDETNPRVLLLPEDPDASAARLRTDLGRIFGADIAIIINDSAGRPWRMGVSGIAIGTAGFAPLEDRIGYPDMFGRPLQVTEVAVADELAGAASFLMGQADERQPVVLIRGASLIRAKVGAHVLIRPRALDLFA